MLAHFVFVAADAEARERRFDEEGSDSLSGGGGIGFGKDDVDAGDGAVGDPGFGAVEFCDRLPSLVAEEHRRGVTVPRRRAWIPAASEPAAAR